MNTKEEAINIIIKESGADTNKISDGYHTFEQLYEHRIVLYIALCRVLRGSEDSHKYPIWKSKKHSDGSMWDGWFLLGIHKDSGKQITYHLPDIYWDQCDFAEHVDRAPEFDGHTSADVLKRLDNI